MKVNSGWLTGLSLAGVAILLGSCGGGGGSTSDGTLRLALTDAPACGFDNVYVTVSKVLVHQSAGAADSDSGWHGISLVPARRVDLLALTNGVQENLGQTSLPAGKYTQMRLVLAENTGIPYANAVKPTGGSEVALQTPSGAQTGLKLNVNIDVPAGKIADFVLDFDACKSVVSAGASGRYNLKPVIGVIPLLADGAGQRIVGYVASSVAAVTRVSAQKGGVVAKATVPNASGVFNLYPVPPGNYELVVTGSDLVTSVVTGVPVTTTAETLVGSSLVRINPATATSRIASGVVSVNGVLADTSASVRVLQAFTGGPTIEVVGAQVDAMTGAFSFSLPVTAPAKTAYALAPTSIAFTSDPTAAAKYVLQAAAPAFADKTQSIDVSAAGVNVPFVFP